MPQQGITGSRTTVWLLSRSGALAGTRFQIADGATRVGRAPDNDVIVHGADCATVSLYHLEISRNGDSCRLRDLDSTNGTWVNGQRITESEVTWPSVIQLGSQGPEFELVLEDAASAELGRTIEVPRSAAPQLPATPPPPAPEHEALLSSAVTRARRMRAHGVGGHTMAIMREVIDVALHRTRRRFRIIGYSLLAALLAVTSAAVWNIVTLKNDKRAIDTHIQQLEAELQKPIDEKDLDRLISQLGDYQDEAESLQRTLLYRLGGSRDRGDYVTRELHAVMAEFGAEVYSIPPDFIARVNHYIEQDQGPDHPLIARALSEASGQIQTIRNILREDQLPQDLAYIPLVESALAAGSASAAGAVGPWQFTQATAKAYGLRVDAQVDERKNLVKSTRASCKYLRDLILDFGTGSSVMLALAAYDSGPTQVKQAVTRTVRDPIKQRNFWYLYRARALPLETREYVPKVFAAILIGRNPQHFGF
jgi:pSer/pThr/pTyr-binding forkhead associated (FHA) protein/soluble lytic murein transglycosylase-like protein